MGLVYHGLMAPVIGPLHGLLWLGRLLRDQAEDELYDEDRLHAALIDLEQRLERGVIDETAFAVAEEDLLERLKISRQRPRRMK
ncbi:MAG: GvpG-like protein [Rhodospirillaceae bacterium]|nr:MAG: GvpG-like protein [Rhodospirillaceae bacterium]